MVKALDPQLKYHGFHVVNVGTYHLQRDKQPQMEANFVQTKKKTLPISILTK